MKGISSRPAEVSEMLLEKDGSVVPDQAKGIYRCAGRIGELLSYAATTNTVFPNGFRCN